MYSEEEMVEIPVPDEVKVVEIPVPDKIEVVEIPPPPPWQWRKLEDDIPPGSK